MKLSVFGLIGKGEATAAAVREKLATCNQREPLVVEINSDGGAVSEAVAIYTLLRSWPGGVTTAVVGWALSAATIVLMAGERRLAGPMSLLMVHAPWTDPGPGNAQNLRGTAAALDQVAESMRAAYRRTGQAETVIARWLNGTGDHWFTAEDALKAGLITEIRETELALDRQAFASCRHTIPPHLLERFTAMTTPDVAAQARQQEFNRQRDIRAHFAPFARHDGMPTLLAQCLDDPNCTADAAGQRVLARLATGTTSAAGMYVPRGGGDRSADFMAAATDVLLMRAGMRVAEPHPAARDLQRSSLVAMAEQVCSMSGIATSGLSQSAIIKAALSTSDFPQLLSNTANKSLLIGYDAAPATHAAWTSQREVKDFKTNTLLVLSETPALALVPELAEYTHGALSEAAETFAIAKYGKVIKLSREAMINDDLSSFTTLPEKMGAAARRLEADKVYERLTANPTMSDSVALFHADHGNLAASGAAPSVTTLGAARAAMRKQKGIAGQDYIDPQPRFLIVPVALETLCEQLLASLVDPVKTNDTTNPAWIRGLTLVADPRLDAASATAWYLAASPQQIEGVARAYLQGETAPHIDTDEGFYDDSLAWKVRHEFAATVIGWRALYKNPGA